MLQSRLLRHHPTLLQARSRKLVLAPLCGCGRAAWSAGPPAQLPSARHAPLLVACRASRGRLQVLRAADTDGQLPLKVSATSLKTQYRRVLRWLSDLKLAIYLMLAVAGLSGIGTVIEQNKSLEFYMQEFPDGPDKVLGFLTWQWVLALQFDHIYTAWYFLGSIAWLAACLAACTSTRQLPMVKVANRWKFLAKPRSVAQLAKDGMSELLPNARLTDLGAALLERGYQVFRRGPSLYAFKGLAGKLGPIGVHASMLLVLAGTTWGAVGGWKGSVMCPEGQGFVVERALYAASPVAMLPAGAQASVVVDAFRVDYRPNGQPAQFYSDLSVVDPAGRTVQRQTISVNKPLRYGGVTMYQTDWQPSTVQLAVSPAGADADPVAPAIALQFVSLEGRAGVTGKAWAAFLPTGPAPAGGGAPAGVTFLVRDLQSVALYDSAGQFVGVRRPGSGLPIEVDGLRFVVQRLLGATGMELKNDPGVPLVYLGFAGMMVTTLQSYLSHSQVWAVQEGGDVYVGGKSNRAKFQFEKEMDDVLAQVPEVAE